MRPLLLQFNNISHEVGYGSESGDAISEVTLWVSQRSERKYLSPDSRIYLMPTTMESGPAKGST
jgi:hypothetical protein